MSKTGNEGGTSEVRGDASPTISTTDGSLGVPDGVIVLHIAEDGSYDLRVWGGDRVQVLWIDDRAPGDRVYCQTSREHDADDLRKLLGGDTIGHAGDGYLDDQTIQAIRAMAWKMEGNGLKPV